MMFVYSCSAVLLGLHFRQHEIGEVFEDPVVFQRVLDDAEKLSCKAMIALAVPRRARILS
jgi:hypothetical protein